MPTDDLARMELKIKTNDLLRFSFFSLSSMTIIEKSYEKLRSRRASWVWVGGGTRNGTIFHKIKLIKHSRATLKSSWSVGTGFEMRLITFPFFSGVTMRSEMKAEILSWKELTERALDSWRRTFHFDAISYLKIPSGPGTKAQLNLNLDTSARE